MKLCGCGGENGLTGSKQAAAAAREGCGRRMGHRLVLNPQINNVLGFGDSCSPLLSAGGLWPVLGTDLGGRIQVWVRDVGRALSPLWKSEGNQGRRREVCRTFASTLQSVCGTIKEI